MKVIFTPDDGDPVVWDDFDPMKLMSVEAETIERYTGDNFPGGFDLNSSLHRRALLWVLLKRKQTVCRFGDFDYRLDQLSFELSDDEKQLAADQGVDVGDVGAAHPFSAPASTDA